ncbi:MAG: hypothetical protein QOE90_3189 [Thermoplasmata archaeon]|jgi:hypothetical protein|nr:hypothetical protein [Thermoplasmata archaeon]
MKNVEEARRVSASVGASMGPIVPLTAAVSDLRLHVARVWEGFSKETEEGVRRQAHVHLTQLDAASSDLERLLALMEPKKR